MTGLCFTRLRAALLFGAPGLFAAFSMFGQIQAGAVLLEVNYDTVPPWPISPDGAGHSLVLAHASYGEDNVRAWAASDAAGGSPGSMESVTPDPLRFVVINEFFAPTSPFDSWF